MAARIPIYLLYSFLTCCCDKGDTLPDEEQFQDRVISFDYVEFELGLLNNFENHPVGRAELEFNQRLSYVRR